MEITLVIMAAGMGSRFGGLKQLEPVGHRGEIIADYSVFDAKAAGFGKIVFVIKREMEEAFRERVFDRISRYISAEYVFQDMDDLPDGFRPTDGRSKPWGTAHAVWAARGAVNAPFMVINADDFYGASAFRDVYAFLSSLKRDVGIYDFCMAGYLLENTLSESGYVSRGVCRTDGEGFLADIEEVPHIERTPSGIWRGVEGGGFAPIAGDTLVSMNAWGFCPGIFGEIERRLADFLRKGNAETAELYLPAVVGSLLEEGRARVMVLPSRDMWYGFTYKEDRERVRAAVAEKIAAGVYPRELWQV